ncbi:MAG: Gfo/Idh/MocA family oxidoreductase [Patescibacteria group bacterium]
MTRVKIIGAGSIGNHLAQAARRMSWDVVVVDVSRDALRRMQHEIYPQRYGKWDDRISLYESGTEPKGGFDVICICTPPEIRMTLAVEALAERPKVLQLEKPFTSPNNAVLPAFLSALKSYPKTQVVVGYDHAVSESIQFVTEQLFKQLIGEIITIDVEFREHWKGIFAAHPWLSGPEDSYLGYWRKGGGALSEHSHALHLFRHLCLAAGLGKWTSVQSMLDVQREGEAEFDRVALLQFRLGSGATGRVVQDVVTLPTKKIARVTGDRGVIEWQCGGHPTGDVVRIAMSSGEMSERVFPKTRPDDFFREMLYIDRVLEGALNNTLSLQSGLDVLRVIEQSWAQYTGDASADVVGAGEQI